MTSPSSPSGAPPLRVFVSYSHDSDTHRERVRELADRLRAEGIDVHLDQYETSPPQGWPQWMLDQVEDADFVLVVCTETYHRRFRGKEKRGHGQGVKWEGAVVTQTLYDADSRNERFIPVLFEAEDADHRPVVLRGASYYRLYDGYEALYRHLTGQPEIVKPALGERRVLLPRSGVGAKGGPESGEADEEARSPSELEAAYARRAEALERGDDVTHLDTEILGIKRKIREGGRLQKGDLLADGRYKLWEVVGSGGFATVWRAYDTRRKEQVAIKVLHGQYSQDRSRRDRFFRGAKRMAQLQHPGIVRVLEEECSDDGHYFFVMEYLAGQDLHRALRDGRVGRDEGVELVLKVGEALAYAHDQGMIHRDVKPANILLGADGQPKLTDFDLVRAQDTTGGTRTGAIGTFVYAAPEQLENAKDVDERADVYGLGMTLVALLYGAPLPGTVMRRLGQLIDALDCGAELRRALHRAVDWELDQRCGSIREFLELLRASRVRSEPPRSPIQVKSVAEKPKTPPGSNIVRIAPGQPEAGTLWEGPLGMRFRYVPSGVYVVGSPEDEPGRFGWEWLPHEVELTRGVWMAETPVTQEQWSRLVPDNPSRFSDAGGEYPVEQVSWYEAVAFANRLSEEAGLEPCYVLNGQKGKLGKDFECATVALLQPLRSGFRLPTEAEWEIAARAGTLGSRYADPLDEIAWYSENSGRQTHPVRGKRPNAWSLHDMLGNVYEWVGDRFRDEQPASPCVDPHGPEAGPARVYRGGSWASDAQFVRAAYRLGRGPGYRHHYLGFRLSRGPWPGQPEAE